MKACRFGMYAALIACALVTCVVTVRAEPADPSTEASSSEPGSGSAPASPPSAAAPIPPGVPSAPPPRGFWDIVKGLPILFYTNETSLGLGAGLLFQFDMPGAPVGRRPSTVTLGAVYTLENQILGKLTPELRFGQDDYVLKLDVVGARYPNRFFGIGNDNNSEVYDVYTDCYLRGELDFRLRPVAEGHALRPLFVGVNVAGAWSRLHEPRPGEAGRKMMFDGIEDPGEGDVFAVGLGPSLAWDSRDSLSWPQRGAFVEAKGTFHEPWLGSQLRYQRLSIDARFFKTMWLEQVLALRVVAQATWGEVPFQRLPQLGGASLFRGWYGGQLRERMLVALEAEYRVPLSRRWALVAFGSVGRVAESIGEFDLRHLRGAGGGGLRLSVDKRDRVNIRLDLAYGDGFHPYLQFREAF